MDREIKVSIDLAGIAVPVGSLWVHARRGMETCSFAYDRAWLADLRAFSLQPALHLDESTHYTDRALFGAVGDSAPDRWGRILMKRHTSAAAGKAGTAPATLRESDFLLQVCDFARQGALRFSLPSDDFYLAPGGPRAIPPLVRLGDLLSASDRVCRDQTIDADLALLTAPGSSVGGARPKASVLDLDGSLLIAKFPYRQDEWDVPLWESVALSLARKTGLSIPDFRLEKVAGRNLLLTKRFDRNGTERIPYLSAMSMLDAYEGEHGSYLHIAETIREHGAQPERDCRELWRRIVFNILVGNTDDHLRNHGFLHAGRPGWRLSPIFDVEPTPVPPDSRLLHTCIDLDSRSASVELALSVCEEFRLQPKEAKNLAVDMGRVVATWRAEAIMARADKTEIDRMALAFDR